MNFQESLDYLYGLQLFGIKLGLENMRVLQSRLPLLQRHLPCVHVAGTNGKGSVSVMLAEILRCAGFKVGLYTSPHLHCFSERIRIDGAPVTQSEIIQLVEDIRGAANDIPVTFFEATTAMALLAFQKHDVDIAVIETGLGGRLDATNIVEPLLCLITPVSYDHSEHLGERLSDIATEKAGIIKDDVPVVLGKQGADVVRVIESVADRKNAKVILPGRDYAWKGSQSGFSVEVGDVGIDGLTCSLPGLHQLDNFAQAIAAVMELRRQGFQIPAEAIRSAGQSVAWPGRLEWWGEGKILADVAHNRAGVDCLANYLNDRKICRIHLVVGLSGERDPLNVLKPLVKFAAAVYAVPVSYGQVVEPGRVTEWAGGQGLASAEYASAKAGLSAALANSGDSEPVVVCGSLYLVAELRKMFMEGAFAV